MKIFSTIALFIVAVVSFVNADTGSLRATIVGDSSKLDITEPAPGFNGQGHRSLTSCYTDGDCAANHYCPAATYDAQTLNGRTCQPDKSNGESCDAHSECQSGWCHWWSCQAKLPDGHSCTSNRMCASGSCEFHWYFQCV